MSVTELSQRGEEFERMPPQDVAAEQCVLGGMLLSQGRHRRRRRGHPADRLLPAGPPVDLRGHPRPVRPRRARRPDHRRRRADQARRADPHRRRPLPAHADRVGAHRGQRRLLRRGSSGSARVLRRLVEAGTRIVQMGYAGDGRRRRRHRRPRPGRGLRGHRAPHERGLPPALGDHGRHLDEIEAIGSHGGGISRRPHRLRRPRRAHQRPAPRPDDRRRRPARGRQVDARRSTSRARRRSSTT